jgi:hypothetical protein
MDKAGAGGGNQSRIASGIGIAPTIFDAVRGMPFASSQRKTFSSNLQNDSDGTMKKYHCIALFLLGGIAAASLAAEPSLGTFTLAAGEKRTITVESNTPLKVGFTNESTPDQIKSCKKTCIGMSVIGDPFSVVAASVGTTIDVKPVGGKAEIVFENREAFPISINVFRR